MEPGWVNREDKVTQRTLVMLLFHRFSDWYAVLYPKHGSGSASIIGHVDLLQPWIQSSG